MKRIMKPLLRLSSLALALTVSNAMAIDTAALWDHSKPAVSEQRFRDAMAGASPGDVLVLQTQIARTYGIRKDFAKAREILASIDPQIRGAFAEAKTRYALELGRTYSSAVHTPESQTPEARAAARANFMKAFELAKAARLDNLAIDALHMMVTVDTEPAAQLDWDLKAVAYMEASDQPDAKKWEGSLRNNVGYALHLAGRYDEALAQYRLSLAAHERAGRAGNVRIAHWMIASTLRAQQKLDEALAIQLRLEKEWDAANEPDPYVYEELEHLYRAKGDAARAQYYAQKLSASRSPAQ